MASNWLWMGLARRHVMISKRSLSLSRARAPVVKHGRLGTSSELTATDTQNSSEMGSDVDVGDDFSIPAATVVPRDEEQ